MWVELDDQLTTHMCVIEKTRIVLTDCVWKVIEMTYEALW